MGAPVLCARCDGGLIPWNGRGALAGFAYESTGARLLQRFKYDGRRDALEVLVAGLAARIGRDLPPGTRVVAVPRHPRRVRETRADPPLDAARALAKVLDLSLLRRGLHRRRPTRPQTGLDPSARRSNVAGAFEASPPRVRGARLLLIDDVVTTGATLAAARRALRRGGARQVICAALCATPAPLVSSGARAL